MSNVIGIMGGMGPLATVDLFKKIVNNSPAACDQEHFRILIDNNPKIPSRIDAIIKGTEDPLPYMIESAKLLEHSGADFIIIPCHTAHLWLKKLRASVKVPIYSITDCTVLFLKNEYKQQQKRVLIWGSTATIKQGLYQQAFSGTKISLIVPTNQEQKTVASAIECVKRGLITANPHIPLLRNQLSRYQSSEGVTALLAGCTEISLLLPKFRDVKKIDPTLILAKVAIALAK